MSFDFVLNYLQLAWQFIAGWQQLLVEIRTNPWVYGPVALAILSMALCAAPGKLARGILVDRSTGRWPTYFLVAMFVFFGIVADLTWIQVVSIVAILILYAISKWFGKSPSQGE